MKLNGNPEYEKLRAKIWLKTRKKVAKTLHRKNIWAAVKDCLTTDCGKIAFHFQSSPTKKDILEYRIYTELINLCSEKEGYETKR